MIEPREKVPDVLDEASETDRRFREGNVAMIRDKLAPETHPDFDGEHCVDCADDIPAARLAWLRIRCIACQTKVEERAKRLGRPEC